MPRPVSPKLAPWKVAAALAFLAIAAIVALPPIVASIADADDAQQVPQPPPALPERLEDLAGSIEPARTFPTQDADAFWQVQANISDELSDLAEGPLAAASASEAARQAELAEPSSRAEREASATALVGASPQEAKAAINQNFGDIIKTASLTPLDAVGTSEVAFFRGEQVAVLEGAGGKPASLAVSTTPMRVPGENGRLAPIDLNLTLEGGSRSTTNGQVEEIPSSSSGTFEVGPLAFEVALPGQQPSSSSSLGDSARFYPEVGPDTDMAVSATSEGAEVFFSLRSPASPETQTLAFDVPAGAELTETATGSFEVVDGESIIARIPVPVAFDSDGTPVPVEASAQGNALTLTTEHRGEDLAYPILVDPIIDTVASISPTVRRFSEAVDSEGNLTPPYGGWYAVDGGGSLDNYAASGAFGDGLYLDDPVASSIHGGVWIWVAPPGSAELTQVDFGPYGLALNGDTSSAGGAMILGTLTDEGEAGQAYTEDVSNGYTTIYTADGESIPEGTPLAHDFAIFGLVRIKFSSTAGDNDHSAYLGGAVAHLSDTAGARLTGELGEMGTATVDAGWTNSLDQMTVPMEATDSELGVKKLEAVAVDENDESVVLGSYVDPCEGGPGSPCPETLAHDVDLNMSLLDEGRYTIKFRAYDAIFNSAGGPDVKLGLDSVPPSLTSVDPLVDGSDAPATGALHLTWDAADIQSGIKEVSFSLNGNVISTTGSGCLGVGVCDSNEYMDIDLSGFDAGQHSWSLESVDGAGNSSTIRSGTMMLAPASGDPDDPGNTVLFNAGPENTGSLEVLPTGPSSEDYEYSELEFSFDSALFDQLNQAQQSGPTSLRSRPRLSFGGFGCWIGGPPYLEINGSRIDSYSTSACGGSHSRVEDVEIKTCIERKRDLGPFLHDWPDANCSTKTYTRSQAVLRNRRDFVAHNCGNDDYRASNKLTIKLSRSLQPPYIDPSAMYKSYTSHCD